MTNPMEHGEFVVPILLSRATPPALERLLIDHGVLVVRSRDEPGAEFASPVRDGHRQRYRVGIRDRVEFDFAARYGVREAIAWQDLLPAAVAVEALDDELARSTTHRWSEGSIPMRESIVRTPVADAVVDRLRQAMHGRGLPWIRLAPWPAGFEGAFNFRFDLDEPELDDWRRVAGVVDALGIEPAVTWCVSTRAAERIPEAWSVLNGRDVQSHGHWHHVHAEDSALNAANVARADRMLREAGFRPEGFAAPAGRIVADLADHVTRHGYRFLSGLAGQSGTATRRDRHGLLHLHALPVCEGAFLESGVDSVEAVVAGYRAAATRAVSRDRPVFWFGHPDRRLGRRPEMLRRLFESIGDFGQLWHVGLGRYAAWFQNREACRIHAWMDGDMPARLQLAWNRPGHVVPVPAVWVERNDRRWLVACENTAGRAIVSFDHESSASIPRVVPEPEAWPDAGDGDWRSVIRARLDWERETPVDLLRGGPWPRRIKGVLRRATDRSWSRRFAPRSWPVEIPSGERAA